MSSYFNNYKQLFTMTIDSVDVKF